MRYQHKLESVEWDTPVLAQQGTDMTVQLPVLGLLHCAPNVLRSGPFS